MDNSRECDSNHIGLRVWSIKKFLVTTRVKVTAMIEEVAKEHQQTLAPLVDELELFVSGLDSLSLAVIVARLEDELMVDPFSGSDATGVPKTVGDFVLAYERAVERAAAEKVRA